MKFKKKFKKFFKSAVFVFALFKFLVDVTDIVELIKKIFIMVMPLIVTDLGLPQCGCPRLA